MTKLYTKATTWCLTLHQIWWSHQEDNIYYCPRCDAAFFYPSSQKSEPVYKKQ